MPQNTRLTGYIYNKIGRTEHTSMCIPTALLRALIYLKSCNIAYVEEEGVHRWFKSIRKV